MIFDIRKPKFELGQKVIDKNGNVETVIGFNSYHFDDNEYWYDVSYDGEVLIKKESFLEPSVEKPKSVWNLKKGDKYYCLSEYCKISEFIWDDTPFDKNVLESGNGFLTKEEAEFELERRKIEVKMLRLGGRRNFKKGENNYHIVCDFDSSHFAIRVFNDNIDGFAKGMIYFDSAKECRNAIETIGENRIKKYIFKSGISCNEN